MPLLFLGHAALARGAFVAARGYYLRCLNISQEVGFYYSIQTSSKYLGKVALEMGEIAEAELYLVQCLTITKEISFTRDIINLLYEFARLRAAQGDSEGALEMLVLVIQHPASKQNRWLEGCIRDSAVDFLAEIEGALPKDSYTSALERGQAMDLEVAIAGLMPVQGEKD